MKIGIITWFSGNNYGTNLQAIALQKYVRSLGHEVKILNFEPPYVPTHIKNPLIKKIKGKFIHQIDKIGFYRYRKEIKEKDIKLINTIKSECILTKPINSDDDYIKIANEFDLLIMGSDQIWNPNGYHPYYYGDFSNILSRKISYAPSLGVNSIYDDVKDKMKHSLETFDFISAREEKGVDLLSSLTNKKIEKVIDPTFLISKDEWSKLIDRDYAKDKKPYVLNMFLTDRKNHWRAAKEFAKINNLNYVIVPYMGMSYFQKGIICAEAAIPELLSLIANAEYIITDSFHISVFSIIFNKQFAVFTRFKEDNNTSQNSRINSLLHMIQIEDHILQFDSKHIPILNEIDYKKVNVILDNEVERCKGLLINAINNE